MSKASTKIDLSQRSSARLESILLNEVRCSRFVEIAGRRRGDEVFVCQVKFAGGHGDVRYICPSSKR